MGHAATHCIQIVCCTLYCTPTRNHQFTPTLVKLSLALMESPPTLMDWPPTLVNSHQGGCFWGSGEVWERNGRLPSRSAAPPSLQGPHHPLPIFYSIRMSVCLCPRGTGFSQLPGAVISPVDHPLGSPSLGNIRSTLGNIQSTLGNIHLKVSFSFFCTEWTSWCYECTMGRIWIVLGRFMFYANAIFENGPLYRIYVDGCGGPVSPGCCPSW
jgi:hypothetical protein